MDGLLGNGRTSPERDAPGEGEPVLDESACSKRLVDVLEGLQAEIRTKREFPRLRPERQPTPRYLLVALLRAEQQH